LSLVRPLLTRIVAIVGFALVLTAAAANQAWLDRHFLPSFFVPRQWYVAIESVVRAVIAAVGLGLFVARFRLTKLLTRAPALTVQVIVAAVLALGAGELATRWIHQRPTGWLLPEEEPRRREDAQLGWVLAPGRTGHSVIGGRPIEYAIDPAGYRVRHMDEPVDRARPTVLFVGESVMCGEGLTWEESIPAQVGTMLGVQSANLAVHGYSTDQTYLRLAQELPRFSQPLAVVSIFMPELFGRNLDDDRPHLAPGLVWTPAAHASRLRMLAGWLVPYRRTATVEQGISVTHEVLDAIVRLARDRGATPIVVVPQFGSEDDVVRMLRERILTADVPSVLVPLDPDWRLPSDRHPNAGAAHLIATAIAERLRSR
jgi:hypothetical protein